MRLRELVGTERAALASDWRQALPSASGDAGEGIAGIVAAVVTGLGAPRCDAAAGGPDPLECVAHDYASRRLRDGASLLQLLGEYRAFRRAVGRRWLAHRPPFDAEAADELERFHELVDRLVYESVRHYTADVDRARDLVLGTLGHDLRNPLNALATDAVVLSRLVPAEGPAADAVKRIKRSTARMSRLIADLLDRTRLRLGAPLPVDARPMHLGECCLQVLDELQSVHPGRKVVLDAQGDLCGTWDPERILQLLSNLIGNALKHGAREAPVDVSLSGDDARVRIRVHNVGRSIPDALQARLFEPLVQGEATDLESTGSRRGLGLGLYIAHEIVRAHHGTLEVVSTDADGTSFVATLPRG